MYLLTYIIQLYNIWLIGQL